MFHLFAISVDRLYWDIVKYLVDSARCWDFFRMSLTNNFPTFLFTFFWYCGTYYIYLSSDLFLYYVVWIWVLPRIHFILALFFVFLSFLNMVSLGDFFGKLAVNWFLWQSPLNGNCYIKFMIYAYNDIQMNV